MTGLHVGQVVHHGRVSAVGMLVDLRGQSPAMVVESLVPWCSGRERVLQCQEYALIVFGEARSLRTDQVPGLLVVENGGVLSTFPTTREWLSTHGFAAQSLLWLQAGELREAQLDSLPDIGAASWLTLGDLTVLDVKSLGAEPEPLRLPPPVVPNFREVLGVPPLSEEAARAAHQEAHAMAARRSWWMRLRDVFARLTSERAPTGGRTREADAKQLTLSPPVVQRWWNALYGWGLRALGAVGILGLLSRRQGRYLQQLAKLFESGDTMEALRRAIPIGGPGAGDATWSLTVPQPRHDLSIDVQRGTGTTSVVPVSSDWLAHLRQLYERAFRELERRGQLDHAAFVLVELLGDVGTALAWLEKTGRYLLAAQLAEARKQPPAECVRLWFLAKDTERAVQLAVKHDVFADAVLRLEKVDAAAGAALRLMWAERRASLGHYLDAVHIVQSLSAARPLVLKWLERATHQGGPASAEAWLLRLSMDTGASADAKQALLSIIAEQSEQACEGRMRLAECMVARPWQQEFRALAAPLLRMSLHEQLGSRRRAVHEATKSLLERVPELKQDWPKPVALAAPAISEDTWRLTVGADRRGTAQVFDAVPLPSGQIVGALGSLGIAVFSRAGKPQGRWTREPVHDLVACAKGGIILTLSNGEVSRVGRFDPVSRRHERWCDLKLRCFAREYDGDRWYVTTSHDTAMEQDTLVCLDPAQADAHALWGVRLHAHSSNLTSSQGSLELATQDRPHVIERWSYQTPTDDLRARFELPLSEGQYFLGTAAGSRSVLMRVDAGTQIEVHERDRLVTALSMSIDLVNRRTRATVSWPWLALSVTHDKNTELHLTNLSAPHTHVAVLKFEGARDVRSRLFAGKLLTCDELGRIAVLDPQRRTFDLFCV